jgi:[ribosomal protein S5]-alanine N-acetyltransferase
MQSSRVHVKPLPSLATRLVTARLLLRPVNANDAGALRAVLRRNREHLSPWQPMPRAGWDTLAGVSDVIARDRALWRTGSQYAWFGFLAGNDAPMLRIALSGVHRGGYMGAYLGYWVSEEYLGRGIASEALAALLPFAFTQLQLHRLQAAVMPRNLRSIRVLQKAGFRREGLARRYLNIAGAWEDHELFAKLAEE